MKIAIICGGPSPERGISLNSARSILDHLSGPDREIIPFYLDYKKHAYQVSKAQLYSNTPSDFDFKLNTEATPLSNRAFIESLKKCDIVFPVIHGSYGEDGNLQTFLEKHHIPFVGASSIACKKSFDKHKANTFIAEQGFFTLPSTVLKIYDTNHKTLIESFFAEHRITRAIVKPASGGSSIGVFSVSNPAEALEKVELLFSKRMDTRVVIEPFAEGKEFTVVILQNKFGQPVALIPTEIEADYTEHQIFDYRKKYLPTRQVTYHCPPRFTDDMIRKIQIQAEQLFSLFGYHDFARFDGWVLEDGNLWFSDFNPISGMEQNSFLFQQASRVGLTHSETLTTVLDSACHRQGIKNHRMLNNTTQHRKPIQVLCGGANSERQVSLMSGTNVWLKLRTSEHYEPTLYLLTTTNEVWKLPYHLTLNHTVEEIQSNCENYSKDHARLTYFETDARLRLAITQAPKHSDFFAPEKMSLETFIKNSDFVFIALHGGMGEDGELQKKLEAQQIPHNGSNSHVSALCMDKWLTSELIEKLAVSGLDRIPGTVLPINKITTASWKQIINQLKAKSVVVKPRGDGCSTGVARLQNAHDLEKYIHHLTNKDTVIPAGTLTDQYEQITLPSEPITDLIFEAFVTTDVVRVKNNALKIKNVSGLLEITTGVLEHQGTYHALSPSITVAEGEVLSLEEKFQGGTGVNITPPPKTLIAPDQIKRAQKLLETLAQKIGIKGYCRIDAFISRANGSLKIIEINTLPGLTPSTVLYHQGLAERPPLYPKELLERFIGNT